MLKKFPWHTLLLSIYPILYLYSANIQYVESSDIWLPIAISISGATLITLIFRPLFKSWVKVGFLTSLIILLFYNYGLYQESCYGIVIPFYPKGIRLDHNFYKWSSLVLILLVIWRTKKAKGELLKLNSLINLFSLVLLGMTLFNIISFRVDQGQSDFNDSKEVQSADDIAKVKSTRPTIYYLVMDAYTRQDILQDYLNFDNSEFINFLRKEGFYVADSAISNYGQTVLSIPSALNMTYLDSIAEVIGKQSEDRWPMSKVMNKSKVLNYLKAQGYKTTAFDASIFDIVYLKDVDNFVKTPGTQLSLYHNLLINSTAIRAFNRRKSIKTLSSEDYHRKKINGAFDKMEKLARKPYPQYIHGHVLAPHQPFLFDKDGKARDAGYDYNIWSPLKGDQDNDWYIEGYTGQLQYINKRLKQLIKAIKSKAGRPSVIIIQGDHGTASELRNHHGFANNDFKERMSIINAYYFPDQDYSKLYPQISPVNSFKVVFNKYFGTNYKLDPDRAYFSDWTHPYDWKDVTEEVRK